MDSKSLARNAPRSATGVTGVLLAALAADEDVLCGAACPSSWPAGRSWRYLYY